MKETVELNNRKVTIIGTAHVSEESTREVEETIEEEKPDLVAVELDDNRFETLRDESGWKGIDVSEAIRDGKGSLLALNLFLSIYQRKIGLKEGVKPGEEMLKAVEVAEKEDIEYALVDRDVTETFERLREELSLWEKIKFLSSFLAFETEIEVEDLKQRDIIGELVNELGAEFPSVKEVFLEERNRYMTGELLEKDFEHAVLVVGAAHVSGIKEELLKEKREPVVDEKEDSLKLPVWKMAKYGLPVFIIGGLTYSFYQIGFSTGIDATSFWILSNGILAMVGAIIARSHPATWLVSFVAAPITSLDPAIGAGMVASYFEAKFYPPRVEELENIAYINGYRELWSNQVGRIILAFVFVSIGSAAATFLSAGYIASILTAV